jgi:Uma2 family endonuclease
VAHDRTLKSPLYARYGIPEVWLVDLAREAIEVHRQPSTQGYSEVRRLGRGQRVSVQALPEVDLAVDEILG